MVVIKLFIFWVFLICVYFGRNSSFFMLEYDSLLQLLWQGLSLAETFILKYLRSVSL